MDETIGAEDVWHQVDYEAAWAPFNERFKFAPQLPRTRPTGDPIGATSD